MVEPPSFLTTIFGEDIKIKDDRPKVTLTFAQSLDAKIAGVDGKQLILSGRESMVMTHWMRTMHDGILVGVGTALNDDPQLNARHLPAGVRHSLPIPIVMDRRCRLAIDCKLIRNYAAGTGKQPWVIYSTTDDGEVLERKERLESAGARIIGSDSNEVSEVLHMLHSLGIRSLMVEGGAQIIDSFARSGLVDRLVVTVAPVVVGPLGIGYTLDPVSLARLSFQASEGIGIDHVISFLSK